MALTLGRSARTNLLRAMVVATLDLAAVGGASAAETAPEQAAGALDEIVVTAEKRAVDLQSTPVAVSALEQSSLDQRGIADLNGLQAYVPNLNFTTMTNFSSGVIVTLRGIGTDSTLSGSDAGVALHMDGVYLGQASTALLSFYDLSRVEVLRGPQGTLYGRNATGGSVNVITQGPRQEFEAFGDVLYGNYDRKRVRAVLGGGLGDRVAARLTATWEQRDGYLRNLVPGGRDGSDKDETNVRGQVRVELSEDASLTARALLGRGRGTGPTVVPLTRAAVALSGINPNRTPNFKPILTNAAPRPADLYEIRADAPQSLEQDVTGFDATLDWNFSGVALKSITGYFDSKTKLFRDGDNTELPLYTKARTEKAHQFTQEINLSSTGDGALEWLVGAFYFKGRQTDTDTSIQFPPTALVPGGATGWQFVFDSFVDTKSWAVFGQSSYRITDALKATLGLRYTKDEKSGSIIQRSIRDPATSVVLVGFPQSGSITKSWTQPTGKLGLEYTLPSGGLLYASFSKGFKSGGISINDPANFTFNPEKINAWEIGSKNRFANNAVELNASAFYYKYKDLQLFSVLQTAPVIQNAAQSTIKGLELEGRFRPVAGLTLNASVSYLDAKFDKFVTKDPALPAPLQVLEDLSGKRLPRAPEWKLDSGAEYEWNVPGGSLMLRADVHWQDEVFFRPQNKALDRQAGYATYDASVTFRTANERWTAMLYGKNLGDKQAISNELVEAGLFGSPYLASVIEPRVFGLQVGFRFD